MLPVLGANTCQTLHIQAQHVRSNTNAVTSGHLRPSNGLYVHRLLVLVTEFTFTGESSLNLSCV